jgi:integrase
MSTDAEISFEFLSDESVSHLNYQQQILYSELREDLLEYLRTKGKHPDRGVGYEESGIRPRARRIHQVFEHTWAQDRLVYELTPKVADEFVNALKEDDITKNDGDSYSRNSKRKFVNALDIYFEFDDTEWTPETLFLDGAPVDASDPYHMRERELLLNASFEFRSPPSYSNVSPEERDRWKAYLAQFLGKPKAEVSPDDWADFEKSWKYPALISSALDTGWRAGMVGSLSTEFIDLANGQVVIPAEVTIKNNESWTDELTSRSVKLLEKWLEQRANKPKYDDSNHIWLNREGNPYNSASLNDLLDNLMAEAGIEENGRNLTWHSIRHSTGMYVYDETQDLEMVAEVLRHKSLEAARKYAHPTPETITGVLEDIQGGA